MILSAMPTARGSPSSSRSIAATTSHLGSSMVSCRISGDCIGVRHGPDDSVGHAIAVHSPEPMIGDGVLDVGGVCADAELSRRLQILDDAVTAEDDASSCSPSSAGLNAQR